MKDMTQTIKDMQAQMSELNAKMREHEKHRPSDVHPTDASSISLKSKKESPIVGQAINTLKCKRQASVTDMMVTSAAVVTTERRVTRSTVKKQKL